MNATKPDTPTNNNSQQYLTMTSNQQHANDYQKMSSYTAQYYNNDKQQQQQPVTTPYYLSLQNDSNKPSGDYLQPSNTQQQQQHSNSQQQQQQQQHSQTEQQQQKQSGKPNPPPVRSSPVPVQFHSEDSKVTSSVTKDTGPITQIPQYSSQPYQSSNSRSIPHFTTPSYPQTVYSPQMAPNSVIIQQVAVARRVDKRKYPKKHSLVLGVIQLMCGLFSVLLSIISITMTIPVGAVAHGVWCGIWSILAGGFGIAAGRHHIVCLIISHMVFSIINCIVVWGQIFTSIAGVSIDSNTCKDPDAISYYVYEKTCRDYVGSVHTPALVLDTLLLIIGTIQFFVALWAASMTCRFYCCSCCQSCCCTCYDNELEISTHSQVANSAHAYPGVNISTAAPPYDAGNRDSGYQHLVSDLQPPPYETAVTTRNEDEYSYIM